MSLAIIKEVYSGDLLDVNEKRGLIYDGTAVPSLNQDQGSEVLFC